MVHFGKKLTFLQFSTFVNEKIAIVLHNGVDIVAYYINFVVVRMPSVSCCGRRLACSGRVTCQLVVKTGTPPEGELMVLVQGE